MNVTANVHLIDGTKIAKADQVTYLGGIVTPSANRNAEVFASMSNALATCQKLDVLWRNRHAPVSWKIQVYDAVIISQSV